MEIEIVETTKSGENGKGCEVGIASVLMNGAKIDVPYCKTASAIYVAGFVARIKRQKPKPLIVMNYHQQDTNELMITLKNLKPSMCIPDECIVFELDTYKKYAGNDFHMFEKWN